MTLPPIRWTLGHKLILVITLLIGAVLIVQGVISTSMVVSAMEKNTLAQLRGEAVDQAGRLNGVLRHAEEDLEVLRSHRAIENYFTSAVFEDRDGMTEASAVMELFLHRVFQAKPKYQRMHWTDAQGGSILYMTGGERRERTEPEEEHTPTLARLAGEESGLLHQVRQNGEGSWILSTTGALKVNGQVEGVFWLHQSLDGELTAIMENWADAGIQGVISSATGEPVAFSKDLDRPQAQRIARGEVAAGRVHISMPVGPLGWWVTLTMAPPGGSGVVLRLALAGVLSALALVVGVNLFMRRAFVNKMHAIGDGLHTMIGGDLEARIPLASRPDEIDAIAERINHLAASLLAGNVQRQRRDEDIHRLSQAVEQSPVGVVLTDTQGIITYANPPYARLTGHPFTELRGHPLHTFIPPLMLGGPEGVWQSLLQGNSWRGEFINLRKDGSSYWEQLSLSPIRNLQDQVTHFIAISEEITAHKEVERKLRLAKEEADRANQAKSDFVANMSHEIRTPMNAIIGLSHLVLRTALDARQTDYLHKIQTAAHHLLRIINDILDFSKIEAGKLELERVDFSLDRMLDNVANVVSMKAEEKGLELLFHRDEEVPFLLRGDPLRLGQVLINLINNAIKFTERGEILVTTRVLRQEGEKAILRFSVKDTGIGMSEEQVGRLFQPFTQADASTTRRFGGTGLGLTISRRLVELMGGQIQVESRAGEGSAFTLTLPLERQMGKEPQWPILPEPDLRGLRVMVVDDSETSRNVLCDMLSAFSFHVTPLPSGEAALQELGRQGNDADEACQLVILDWKMPGLSGMETAHRIKGLPLSHGIPPILLVTAYGQEEVLKDTAATQVDGFLMKPVSPSLLFDTVIALFRKGNTPAVEAAPATQRTATAHLLMGARLLLVEDNTINQQVARELLESAHAHVTVANDGVEALELLQQETFDAVLMDIQMPRMDGYEATRQLRDLPPLDQLPVIAMTANAMSGDRERCLSCGMNDHVPKPIDPRQLFSVLQKWLRGVNRAPVSPPPPRPQGEDEGVELPAALPGIDLAATLNRLGGMRSLLVSVLEEFHTSQAHAADRIVDAVRRGEIETALNVAHTLKGVSGNLGAMPLYQAAAALEESLKQRAPHEEALPLEALRTRLEEVMTGLARWRASRKAAEPPPTGVPAPMGREVAALLNELETLIANNRFDAVKLLDSLDSLTGGHGAETRSLRQHLLRYDFEGARTALQNLRERLSPPSAPPSEPPHA